MIGQFGLILAVAMVAGLILRGIRLPKGAVVFKTVILVLGIYFVLTTLARYYNFSSESVDVAYYHQAVWQLASFKIPRIWDSPNRFIWGDHFEPILLFFAPLYWLARDAGWLMIVQVLVTVSGIVPLYLVVSERWKNEALGLSVAASYLLFGGLQMGYAYGFHPIVLFPTIFFWAYYFLEGGNRRGYLLFLVLGLLVKEEISFIIGSFGLYLLLFRKKRVLGTVTTLAGLGWYIICFKIIFPLFSPIGFGHFGQYGSLGQGGLEGVVVNSLTNPGLFLSTLVTPTYKIGTFVVTLGSFGFLPLVYPPSWIFIIPPLLEKLLSNNIAALNGFHYSAVIWAMVVVAGIETLEAIRKSRLIKLMVVKDGNFWAVVLLVVAVGANLASGYRPLALASMTITNFEPKAEVATVNRILGEIPPGASVAAWYQIAPHINRPIGLVSPLPKLVDQLPETATYVILDYNLPLVLNSPEQFYSYIDSLRKSGRYRFWINENKVVVLVNK